MERLKEQMQEKKYKDLQLQTCNEETFSVPQGLTGTRTSIAEIVKYDPKDSVVKMCFLE